jgi:hypothetical protein
MHDLPIEQIGNGGKPNMRMGAHADAFAWRKLSRPHVIEEDKRTDFLAPAGRQHAPNTEAAQVLGL